ncbi:hypothetical protein P3T35_006410 [Kitasatospora sp. GP30]|uniref:hypothetical protein n=1 Tax=Kitasatospora sp. GP30 TaxID=3035084 RepID=UPI00117BF99F|nr:hypothetical protein [Kitasatospora sp. GP30]MDH6144368.1 hypothetical protein [Kitasatospora sp. GP30]
MLSIGSISALKGNFAPLPAQSTLTRPKSFLGRTREGLSWVRKSRFIGVSTIATGVANVLFQITILLLIVHPIGAKGARQRRAPPTSPALRDSP